MKKNRAIEKIDEGRKGRQKKTYLEEVERLGATHGRLGSHECIAGLRRDKKRSAIKNPISSAVARGRVGRLKSAGIRSRSGESSELL